MSSPLTCLVNLVDTIGLPNGICAPCETKGCTGDTKCALGYYGDRCELCEPSYWMDTSVQPFLECKPCGATDGWVIAIAVGVAVVLAAIVLWFNNSPDLQRIALPLRNGMIYIQGRRAVLMLFRRLS